MDRLCRMRRWLLFFLVFAIHSWLSVSCAITEFTVEQFTTSDGLVNNTVRCIMQDSKGRLWLGTSNGLSRYDGCVFVNYRLSHDKKSLGLADRRVKSIYEGKDGLLWIGTMRGFSCLDMRKDVFINYASRGLTVPDMPALNIREARDAKGAYGASQKMMDFTS